MWRFCDLTGRNRPPGAVPAPQEHARVRAHVALRCCWHVRGCPHEQGGISYLEMARVLRSYRKFRKFQEIPGIPGNSSFADKNYSFADKIPVRTENSRNFQHFRVLTGAGVVSSARAKLDMWPLVMRRPSVRMRSPSVFISLGCVLMTGTPAARTLASSAPTCLFPPQGASNAYLLLHA